MSEIFKVSFLRNVMLVVAAVAAFFAATAATEASAQETNATPAMWRVSDADSEFILLGTLHFLPDNVRWQTPAFHAALEQADQVFFEFDAEAPYNDKIANDIITKQGVYPAGLALSQVLSPTDAAKLQEIAAQTAIEFNQLNQMRPWLAFIQLSGQLIVQEGFNPQSGVDKIVRAQAAEKGKELKYFETLEQQLGFFTALSPDTERNLLLLTIQHWDEEREDLHKLLDAWKAGDQAFLDQQSNEVMREEAPEIYDVLIIKRNLNWAETIIEEMRNGGGTALVAVGAAHLVGEDRSLPALLRAEGFTVERYGVDGKVTPRPAANDNEIDAILESMQEAGAN